MRWLSAAVWEGRLGQCEVIFHTTKNLPDVVHRLPPAHLPFFDGDFVFGSVAWPMISSLAAIHGDEEVNFLTLDPVPEYFLASKGFYGGFTIPTESSNSDFGGALYGSTLVGSPGVIGYTAEVVAIFGDSLNWGIWIERNVAGLVVAADPVLLDEWQLDHGPFLTSEDALQGFMGLYFGFKESAETAMLEKNYGSFS